MATATSCREIHNWGGELVTRPRQFKVVYSVTDIQDVVSNPAEYPSPVRAAGSRHSTTRCFEADDGTLLDMSHLDDICEPDEENLTITVGAGALYYNVSNFLQARGLMHYVNTEIGNLTAGAACVGQTKDSAFPDEHGQVSSYVYGCKMITANGDILEVDEDSDPTLMTFVRGSFGLLGIVYEVTFKVAPLRLMKLYHKFYTLDTFLANLDAIRASDCAVMYFMAPHRNRVMVEFRSYQPDEHFQCHKDGQCKANKQLLPFGSDWQFSIRNMAWAKVVPLIASVSLYIPSQPRMLRDCWLTVHELCSFFVMASFAGYNIRPAHQTILYSERPLKGTKYTFSIYAFGVERFPEVMRAYFDFVREYYERVGWRCTMFSVGYRVFRDTKSYISYTADGEAMTLDPVTNSDDPGWYPFLHEYNDFCLKHGGKPLMNQTPAMEPRHVTAAFGETLKTFEVVRRRLDPGNRFLSKFFRQLYGIQV